MVVQTENTTHKSTHGQQEIELFVSLSIVQMHSSRPPEKRMAESTVTLLLIKEESIQFML